MQTTGVREQQHLSVQLEVAPDRTDREAVFPVDYFTETVVTSDDSTVIPVVHDTIVSTEDPSVAIATESNEPMVSPDPGVVTSVSPAAVSTGAVDKYVSTAALPSSDALSGGADAVEGKVVEVKVIPVEMLYDGTLWSQFDFTKSGDEEMFVSESEVSPLTVSDGVSDVARQVEVTTKSDSMCLSIRDITKREKDRIKKRELRANPVFREKEKVKAKERMQNRRQDPIYREQERQRDRERRQLARRRNLPVRERERERDKEYKKNFRYGHRIQKSDETSSDTEKTLDSLPCHVYMNTQYTSVPS
ncbi:serine/threonine-protein kinase fray2-like [Haliotis rufescens]|uniref:serine/threonine-protein kinase fray2-like n=1 Tax=Haliotis rufescens TaxID=6454 RepID=UPI00201F5ABB|nr:serine/threonine-protein kinase fray2-like [Haliotis rufescens]XP_048257234.1 serine/threonine-protein kinase fray2-like [Haliotis rufescens]